MRLIAHRGFAGRYPENTVGAVRAAARHADAVEVDVRRCASGELVVVHDERVDRVTDGTGRVADLTLAELGELSVLGSGEPVPALAAALEALPAGVDAVVELKERGLAADALRLADRVRNDVAIWSFEPAALREARDAAPGVPRALLVAELAGGLGRARDLGCAAVSAHHRLCTPAFVARAGDAGLRTNAWTVRDRGTAARLARAGVDGVVADVPDVLG